MLASLPRLVVCDDGGRKALSRPQISTVTANLPFVGLGARRTRVWILGLCEASINISASLMLSQSTGAAAGLAARFRPDGLFAGVALLLVSAARRS